MMFVAEISFPLVLYSNFLRGYSIKLKTILHSEFHVSRKELGVPGSSGVVRTLTQIECSVVRPLRRSLSIEIIGN